MPWCLVARSDTAIGRLVSGLGGGDLLVLAHGVSNVVAGFAQLSSRGPSWISSQDQQGLQTVQSTHSLQGGLMWQEQSWHSISADDATK